MKPRIYAPTITDTFTTNGYGTLPDCISCTVTQETSTADGLGANELDLEYPLEGQNAEYLVPYNVILAQANDNQQSQPFDIYSVERTESSIKVNAKHVFFRLAGFPIVHFPTMTTKCTSLSAFCSALNGKSFYDKSSGFTVSCGTDVAGVEYYLWYQIKAMKSIINNGLSVIGAEMLCDRFNIKLSKANTLGTTGSTTIRYGKQITSIEHDNDCSKTYNSMVTYYSKVDDKALVISSTWINSGKRPYLYADLEDYTSSFSATPSASDLDSVREPLKVGVSDTGKISVSVDMVALWQSPEYEKYKALEQVGLYDTVRLIYEPLGLNENIRVVKTVYDTLSEKYTSIELGSKQKNLADTIADLKK